MLRKIKAFTLIELLVVVLIIGILAAVAVPQYQKAVMKSRIGVLKPIVESIALAQEIYYLANGHYADDMEKLDINFPDAILEGGVYSYPWGWCVATAKNAGCYDERVGISYNRHYKHAENRRTCCALNEAAKKICSQFSGRETADWTGVNPYVNNETQYCYYRLGD